MEKLRLTNPIWGSMLDLSGVKTIMLFPLRHGGELLGYLWTVNFNVDNTLIIKETLEVTTFLIASEISSYLLLNKLQTMSTIDSLTGVKNRNVMNNRIDQIVAGRKPTPKAVIFADLNGIKYTNDEQGHLSGDKVLRSAAEILQYVFPKEDVYRAGGDEFMVLASALQSQFVCVHNGILYMSCGNTFPELLLVVGNSHTAAATACCCLDDNRITALLCKLESIGFCFYRIFSSRNYRHTCLDGSMSCRNLVSESLLLF